MEIAEIKKTLRIMGMTYAELSEKSGVPLAMLKNIFCGERRILINLQFKRLKKRWT